MAEAVVATVVASVSSRSVSSSIRAWKRSSTLDSFLDESTDRDAFPRRLHHEIARASGHAYAVSVRRVAHSLTRFSDSGR
jgi:hypothetical protein